MSLTDSDLDPSILEPFKEGYGGFAQAMRESAKHILYATLHSNAMNGLDSDTVLRYVTPDWKKAVTTAKTSSIIAFALISCAALPIEILAAIKKKDKEPMNQGGIQ